MSLLRSTSIVSLWTMLSRLLGLVRDIMFARIFGADGGTDAFFIAFKIPNFLRRLFAEGAFAQAFVPVLTEYKETQSRESLQDLINHTFGALALLLTLITSIGIAFAPLVVTLFAFGLSDEPERYQLTVDMLRITFPYILFIALTAFSGSILNSFGQFAAPAFTPILLNLSLIGAALWLSEYFNEPVMALAWGVAFAGAAQLFFQIPFLMKINLLPRFSFKSSHQGVRKITRLMIPGIIGSSAAQINLLLDTLLASFLAAGTISWLYFADRLVEFPLGVFGVALATVILPKLSREHTHASSDAFNNTLNWASRWVVLIAIPATIGLVMLGEALITAFFGYGDFDRQDIIMSSVALMVYSAGLLSFIMIKVLAPGFYARQDTKTPVRYGIISLILNMVFNLIFVLPLYFYDFYAPHIGLSAATVLSSSINAYMLMRGLQQRDILHWQAGWHYYLLRIGVASAALFAYLYSQVESLDTWIAYSASERISTLTLHVVLGAGIYLLSLWLLGLRKRHLSAR